MVRAIAQTKLGSAKLFFSLIWSVLYILIAITGWLIFSGANRLLTIFWSSQLLLNGLWSWLFFGMHRTNLGLLDIVALLLSIVALIFVARQHRKINMVWLMGPYLIWVACATVLNAKIYIFNPN